MTSCYDNSIGFGLYNDNPEGKIDDVRPNFRFGIENINFSALQNTVKVVNCSHPILDPVPPSMLNARVLRLEVETRGGSNPLAIANIKLHNKGTSVVKKAKLYYTGANAFFNTDNLIGEFTSDDNGFYTFVLNNPISIPHGKYNF